MTQMTELRLKALFERFTQRRIAVIGDIMLDRYVWGSVSRISPEAPVPVIDIEDESFAFGGAANVTHNIKSLGAEVLPIGIIGDDGSGKILKDLFHTSGFLTEGILIDTERPTTVKTRVIAHNQHVVRTDRESKSDISGNMQIRLMDLLEVHITEIDGIILEDYDKGLLALPFISAIIKLAQKHQKLVFVDPKFDHFFDYKGVTLFKPNLKEATDKLGYRLDSKESLIRAGKELLQRIECHALLITLGEEGMVIFEGDEDPVKIPTKAKKVHDVSGAGDTVIATMALAMTSEANLLEAASMANQAAGIVCGEVGIVPIDRDRLFQTLKIDIASSV